MLFLRIESGVFFQMYSRVSSTVFLGKMKDIRVHLYLKGVTTWRFGFIRLL